ncbi:hypothetical protein EIN_374280 [Entamoeba invadens IP1]|uniref:Uncharacterized protein n=1 Tax=Entamoeba invadens IP1 TaxID=370355 RepID=A0A0A1TVV6_ENTIV|nr:hypothetical protein EIN_374280 [Entamoeba invadens IP1]ELP83413.1 hypothetical protein EIN_374280 [Entamoeba invadens IP1]|eukprot:XP_004182759.1 hypothetical protein EIN_374280 [Entamoeba invadens IP1]
MSAKHISHETTTEIVEKFATRLKTRENCNVSIVSKYKIFLDALCASPESEVSPFVECKLPFLISFYPQHLNDINGTIESTLDTYLLSSYINGGVQGILLSYDSFETPTKSQISFDEGVITIPLVLNCVLFVPTLNTYLIGSISQKSFDHVALLVFGIFNVFISNSKIRERLIKKVAQGVLVRFKVVGMNLHHNPPIFEGELSDDKCKIVKIE